MSERLYFCFIFYLISVGHKGFEKLFNVLFLALRLTNLAFNAVETLIEITDVAFCATLLFKLFYFFETSLHLVFPHCKFLLKLLHVCAIFFLLLLIF